MNRYLAIPLSLTLIGFVIVYCSQTNSEEPTLGRLMQGNPTFTDASTTKPAVGSTKSSIKPLALDDAKVMILDQWPTLTGFALGSRGMPNQRLYAALGELAEQSNGRGGGAGMSTEKAELAADRSSFLCTLQISSEPHPKLSRSYQTESFPVHVDRFTHEAHVFADARWQKYSAWRDARLPEYRQLTGWNKTQAQPSNFDLGGAPEPAPDEADF